MKLHPECFNDEILAYMKDDPDPFGFNGLKYIQTEDDTIYHKPDPRVFGPTLNRLSENEIKREEVVYVGDGLNDMKAAQGAGLEFIGVGTGLTSLEEFAKHQVRAIPKLSDILEI